ncbi:hypothetical protein [Stenotrophomonas sp. ZAC14D2_NAIMI4_6]|uniref:hypothetical protein n=1 Tax=Stenotrophomonas sp. ZAC14D2_NAIMI4_6 TaxID=2072406 RepID=UPI000D53ECA3|nr:hypothetical protein [Stenotrophomonas sp. ZAC14D2_NAIMI4_6]AWH21885.1 hypothetical protein C1933_12035 [Stenotrophomonas sp. ZAC14D2_NAIMI4_6]
MKDARELLSSGTGPKAMSFDGSTGGPSTQEILAALAYVHHGLGRELLEALWWPESGSRRREQLRQEVIALVAPEFTRQMHALADARTSFGIAKACISWTAGQTTDKQRRELQRTEQALEDARAAAWPNNTMEQLGVLAGAVMGEMAECCECPACEGRRVVQDPAVAGAVNCARCGGTGYEPFSGRRRGTSIGADCSAYSRFWRPVYEWMLANFRAAEARAAVEFRNALLKAA